jgi:hypothetical protein
MRDRWTGHRRVIYVGGDRKGLERGQQGRLGMKARLPGLAHHGTLRHCQSALFPDGASFPLPLGLHCGKGGCPG